MSTFNIDLAAESILGEFLDKFLYYKNPLENFERVTDARQYLGCDVIFEKDGQKYIIDEKGYLSRATIQSTFVLELCYYNKHDDRTMGWLYDSSNKTTHYLFCWANRDNVDLKKLKLENIKTVEAWLINKKTLLNYLDKKYKINIFNINSKIEGFLNDTDKGPVKLSYGCKVVQSNHLKEKPLNIVMSKDEYIASGSVEGKYCITNQNFLLFY